MGLKKIIQNSGIEGGDHSGLSVSSARSGSRRYAKEAAEDAVILLAQGILKQFDLVMSGRGIVRQSDTVPHELHKAMTRIGRLYIEESLEDRAACVHDVLARACHPLGGEQWAVPAFRAEDFRFAAAVLIEPNLRVPTSECAVIAAIPGGFGEDNVIEYRLHNRLREACNRLGGRRHEAYMAVREFLVRNSLVTNKALIAYLDGYRLLALEQFIVDEFYDTIPELWLIDGKANRCAHCGSLLRPHPSKHEYRNGFCPVRQCNAKQPPSLGDAIDPAQGHLLIARPQVLAYWTGPGIDEVAIYDAAVRLGLQAEIYPESDQCDVSIGGRAIGIDAKSYSCPISLALRLNRGIGGLINYQRRVVAVGDEMLNRSPHYIRTLRDNLDPKGLPATLEIMTVKEVIAAMDGMRHAIRS
jgi:hypothetical protein